MLKSNNALRLSCTGGRTIHVEGGWVCSCGYDKLKIKNRRHVAQHIRTRVCHKSKCIRIHTYATTHRTRGESHSKNGFIYRIQLLNGTFKIEICAVKVVFRRKSCPGDRESHSSVLIPKIVGTDLWPKPTRGKQYFQSLENETGERNHFELVKI